VQRFDIPARRKDHLVRGLDAIGATLDHAEAIRAFQARHLAAQPWLV
jgi:3-isopropylmalate/(R)-2-methylmalate dehydratase small subunit